MENRLYLDVHVLQTLPPSCVNRDDTGSPKTAVYGGVTRARVSSQAWKRAMRLMFTDIFPDNKLGLRTKRIIGLVAKEIINLEPALAADGEKLAQQVFECTKLKLKGTVADGTGALFFISVAQTKALAKLAVEIANGVTVDKIFKARVEKAMKEEPGVDVALFGRMVADDPSMNNDACAQVAHGISTHKVHNEADYFTAVDDCSPEDNAGAGHIGTVEFNSSTMYRYATVAVHELYKQLGDDTPAATRGFVEAFVRSMPTGKQNTFANRTLPDAVYVCLRKDQPVNLAGAFEKPVPASEEGYVELSKKRLAEYAKAVYGDYAGAPHAAFGIGTAMGQIAQIMPLGQLLDNVENIVGKECECE